MPCSGGIMADSDNDLIKLVGAVGELVAAMELLRQQLGALKDRLHKLEYKDDSQ